MEAMIGNALDEVCVLVFFTKCLHVFWYYFYTFAFMLPSTVNS